MPVITASFRAYEDKLKELIAADKNNQADSKENDTNQTAWRWIMKNIVNNYSSIEQLTNQYLNKQKSTDKKTNDISFEEILKAADTAG